ncbi:OFA family MFS transporter [Acinetobacter sp. V102_4]|uniref:OFA family MFS transporter n=1 Tax=Acinetobacter sp. V102_4 TaxID=3072984 RepID=UPI00287C5A95|nr:OFA family MFS transporter [Acinetobacter sp. V102_4]MDS7928619.1 OFA family MFS transporter [Acinetobacter sp. V102_4]
MEQQFSLLAKERTIAHSGYNRWLLPPAALAIHLSIGMAYGFSVFWLPLSKALGIDAPIECAKDMSLLAQLFTTTCDWSVSTLSIMYTLFFVFLGSSAFLFGGWLEHAGPRKAGVVAAFCWAGGLILSALGVYTHQLWLMWLGGGVGGIGLGLGYISPVSTLIKWFPDRRGLATGLAIMGFGGGAMIGAPLADKLMKFFATADSVGVWQTFLVLAGVYFIFMIGGAFGYRIPPSNWKPNGWEPTTAKSKGLVTNRHVHLTKAWKTKQFWLIWGVLCLNVSAGIGILAMASPLLQEVFGGRLIGLEVGINELTTDQKMQIATFAAGFTGLLSLFNIGGRFFWASASDFIGRKNTYFIFLALGFLLYVSVPQLAHAENLPLFVLAFCVILSMYGGGFSTVPAYLADIFGTQMVGAIHGRLLTAWSVAGVLGTLLITNIRDYQLAHGVAQAQSYDITMYILAGMLAIGFVLNLLIKPVDDDKYMTDAELAAEKALAHEKLPQSVGMANDTAYAPSSMVMVILAWAVVGIPLLTGIWFTLQKAVVLFH